MTSRMEPAHTPGNRSIQQTLAKLTSVGALTVSPVKTAEPLKAATRVCPLVVSVRLPLTTATTRSLPTPVPVKAAQELKREV